MSVCVLVCKVFLSLVDFTYYSASKKPQEEIMHNKIIVIIISNIFCTVNNSSISITNLFLIIIVLIVVAAELLSYQPFVAVTRPYAMSKMLIGATHSILLLHHKVAQITYHRLQTMCDVYDCPLLRKRVHQQNNACLR